MRYPAAVAASILSVACYFALFWGFDALRILTSPIFGLDDAWRSDAIYRIARWGGIDGQGLHDLAAFAGMIKLAVAGLCGAYLVDCIRSGGHARANPAILELALVLVIAASFVTVIPAVAQHDAVLIRTCVVNLVLASLAAALGTLALPQPDASSDLPVDRGAAAADEPQRAPLTPAA